MLLQSIKHTVHLLLLTAFLLSSLLQYSHDTSHTSCEIGQEDAHEHPSDCSQCWYIAHQIASDFSFTPIQLIPKSINITPQQRSYEVQRTETTKAHLIGNKDPPPLLHQLAA